MTAGAAIVSAASASSGTQTAIIYVDLASSKRITSLRLNVQYSGWSVRIDSSDNSTTWTTVHDFKGKLPSLDAEAVLSPPTSARYWRLYHTYESSGSVPAQSYNEIAVYGCP